MPKYNFSRTFTVVLRSTEPSERPQTDMLGSDNEHAALLLRTQIVRGLYAKVIAAEVEAYDVVREIASPTWHGQPIGDMSTPHLARALKCIRGEGAQDRTEFRGTHTEEALLAELLRRTS